MHRFLYLIGIISAQNCPQTGLDTFIGAEHNWYEPLTLCALYGGISTPSDLYNCLNTLLVPVAVGPSLLSAFSGDVLESALSGCFACAFEFAKSAGNFFMNNSDLALDCWNSPDTYVVGKIFSSSCQWDLYAAIQAFDACSGNSGFDFVTGQTSVKCSMDEFIDFSIKYMPVSQIASCSFNSAGATLTDVIQCVAYFEEGKIGTLFPFLSDYQRLGCRPCFDALVGDIMSFSSTSCVSNGDFDTTSCSGEMNSAMNTFGRCTGGMVFDLSYQAHCEDDDARLLTALRPYTAVMTCAFNPEYFSRRLEEFEGPYDRLCRRLDGRILSTNNVFDCLEYYSAFQEVISPMCNTYMHDNFLNNAMVEYASYAACQEDISSVACTSSMKYLYGPVYEFERISGIVLNTNSTICSIDEWAQLTDSQTSYIPSIRCAMRSSSLGETLDCMESGDLMNISCTSCFKQLAIEAFTARNSLLDALCIDPYSINCADGLNKPLSNFEICSGHYAKDINNDKCSSDEVASDSLAIALELIISSLTPTEAILKYNQQVTNANCVSCHVDLIEDLFALDDPLVCANNFTSWDCYMMGGALIDKYWKCSKGWERNIAVERSPFIPMGEFCPN